MSYKYRSIRGLEDAIYKAQYDLILSEHGKAIADNANYGWGVDMRDDFVSVATKVYHVGILQSDAKIGDSVSDFVHEWSEYNSPLKG